MKKYKKIWIPLLISGLVVLYYGIIISILLVVDVPIFLSAIIIPISIIFTIMMIYQCIQRIKEIKGGEYDDLSQY